MIEAWPSVTAVVPTHDRPELMRAAVRSIVEQDYPGDLDVIVVFDRAEPDESLVDISATRRVSVVRNERTPGLAGGRNTGILLATGEWVAFCDDDDTWEPSKLRAQVEALVREPGAEFVSTAMTIDYDGETTVRLAGTDRVTHGQLVRSRMAMLHSSSFLARRDALLDGIGLVSEEIPQSMNEDWDILLRASQRRPIVHVDEALVRIRWGSTSYFAQKWEVRNSSQLWLLEHHPEILRDHVAAGHAYGKLAFGSAALGQRRQAWGFLRRSWRANWREPRAYITALVLLRLVRWQTVMRELNKRGHGI
jgi:glycosyltransferase involved in cell wall biosynthesis